MTQPDGIDFTPINSAPPVPVGAAPAGDGIDFTPVSAGAPAASPAPSFWGSVAQSMPVQYYKGALDGVHNVGADILNHIPGVNIPQNQGSGLAYNLGSGVGNMGAYTGMGELGAAGLGLAEGLPLIGRGAAWLGDSAALNSAMRRVAGNAGYGALTNPSSPLQGGEVGAGLSAIGDLLPGGGFLQAIRNNVSPALKANNILQTLSGGNSVPDTVNSALSGIRNAFQQRSAESGNLYNSVFNNLPSGSIFENVANPATDSSYLSNQSQFANSFSPRTAALHQQFLSNPTFQNAHNLQSQIASNLRNYSSKPADAATQGIKDNLSQARDSLQNDMNSYLQTSAPQAIPAYQAATNYYRDNVVPYGATPNLRAITRAKGIGVDANGNPILANQDIDGNPLNTSITQTVAAQPQKIASLFNNANPSKQALLNKVMSDLSPQTKNSILFSQLSKPNVVASPENLLGGFQKVQNQPYVTPEIAAQFSDLQNRLKKMQTLTSLGGAAFGGLGSAVLGSHLGDLASMVAGLGGVAAGNKFANPIADALAHVGSGISNTAPAKTVSASLPYLKALAISNIIPTSRETNNGT